MNERKRRRTMCIWCGEREATWAWQIIAGESAMTLLGSHYRGFPMQKLCADCKDIVQAWIESDQESDPTLRVVRESA